RISAARTLSRRAASRPAARGARLGADRRARDADRAVGGMGRDRSSDAAQAARRGGACRAEKGAVMTRAIVFAMLFAACGGDESVHVLMPLGADAPAYGTAPF